MEAHNQRVVIILAYICNMCEHAGEVLLEAVLPLHFHKLACTYAPSAHHACLVRCVVILKIATVSAHRHHSINCYCICT